MDSNLLYIIIGAIALIAGIIAGKFIFAKNTQKKVEEAELQAQKILADAQNNAETLKKEKMFPQYNTGRWRVPSGCRRRSSASRGGRPA